MNDELDISKITISSISNNTGIGAIGSAGGSGAVGSTYNGYIPGYGPVPMIQNGVYPPGQVTVPSTSPVYTGIGIQQPNYHTNIHISGPNPVLTTDKGKIDLNELAEMMKIMRERLLILVPDFEKHKKYEALKKAYDHYKLIEAMVIGNEDGK